VLKKRKGNTASAGGGVRTWRVNAADNVPCDCPLTAKTIIPARLRLSACTTHRNHEFLGLCSWFRGVR